MRKLSARVQLVVKMPPPPPRPNTAIIYERAINMKVVV